LAAAASAFFALPATFFCDFPLAYQREDAFDEISRVKLCYLTGILPQM
jgi:hypothetical protein